MNTCCIRYPSHFSAERINFFDQMPFANASDCGVAAHGCNAVNEAGNEKGMLAHACTGKRGFTARMTAPNDNDIKTRKMGLHGAVVPHKAALVTPVVPFVMPAEAGIQTGCLGGGSKKVVMKPRAAALDPSLRWGDNRTRAGMRFRFFSLFVLFFLNFFSPTVQANAFRNHVLQLPVIGWMGMDTSLRGINPGPWGFGDAITVGVGYMHAIDYNLWWLIDTSVGIHKGNVGPDVPARGLASLGVAPGLRYNFLEHQVRPYISGHVQYLQFFLGASDEESAARAAADMPGGYSAWFGLRPALGIEFIVGPEVGLQFEVGYSALFHPDHVFRQNLLARVAATIYL
jgi:hypothetical protein